MKNAVITALAAAGVRREKVSIGGRSRAHDLPEAHAAALADAIARAVEAAGGSLMLTFSRRTPAAAKAVMTARLAHLPGLIWDGTGTNPDYALRRRAGQPVELAPPELRLFTLRAALAAFGKDAQIVVAELVPAVVAWARGPLGGLYGDSLSDPRVQIHDGDVGALIRVGEASYDAILLDVDNGPGGLSRKGNDSLYDQGGLAAARRALRPGGVLEVWSSTRDSDFTRRLGRAGYAVEEVGVRAHKGRGARHVIWVATSR